MTRLPTHQPIFLGVEAPVPVDRPFTRAQARAAGASDRQLASWVAEGKLLRPLAGVFHAAQLPDGLTLRAGCLKLVAPPDAVITDETAAWFHGATTALPPNAHRAVPPVSMHLSPGNRLRNGCARSGERTFARGEVVELDGVRVTSMVRTMCDLGRMRDADRAFAGMDAMANVLDTDLTSFVSEATGGRFRGYRGVVQLRAWAPHVRRGSQSPGESILRKRWLECPSLPYPEVQVPVPGPRGLCFVDVGNEELRYGAEYDGVEWHGPAHAEHDAERRSWLEEHEAWTIDVFGKENLYGRGQDVHQRLREGAVRARRRHGLAAWSDRAR